MSKSDAERAGNRQEVPISAPMRAFESDAEEILRATERVFRSGQYVGGPEVEAFETEFARYVGAAHAIGVGSGTSALELALRTCGVCAGDEVVTVSMTAVATVAAIEIVGAAPVLVDIEPGPLTMDPGALRRVLEARPIKALIPVHLYGHSANLPVILELAEAHGVPIVEDCAQAHGATLGGKPCGTWGALGAFSFYPTKNLGALGDAGAVVTNDPELAERARALRQYGWRERYISDVPGMNSRLDPVQAAILRVKLPHLERAIERRRSVAHRYDARLRGCTALTPPSATVGVRHVYHQYVVRCPTRNELRAHLAERGIQSTVHFPSPVHLQPAYAKRVPTPGGLPHTEQACREILSLPCFPELTDAEVDRVVEALGSYRPGRMDDPQR